MRVKTYDAYFPLVSSILNRCGLIRRKALLKILMNYDDEVGITKANKIIDNMESKFLLLSNESDIVFSIDIYRKLNPEDYNLFELEWNTGSRRISKRAKLFYSFEDKAILDCMDIVADLSPESLNFVVSNNPWYVQFILPEEDNLPTRLFQITKVRKGYEIPTKLMLLNLPKTTNDFILKENIRRIAIIEEEHTAHQIPYVGFNIICVMDKSDEDGYRIVEKRELEEAWSEYQF